MSSEIGLLRQQNDQLRRRLDAERKTRIEFADAMQLTVEGLRKRLELVEAALRHEREATDTRKVA